MCLVCQLKQLKAGKLKGRIPSLNQTQRPVPSCHCTASSSSHEHRSAPVLNSGLLDCFCTGSGPLQMHGFTVHTFQREPTKWVPTELVFYHEDARECGPGQRSSSPS